jgi:hypothetical protein
VAACALLFAALASACGQLTIDLVPDSTLAGADDVFSDTQLQLRLSTAAGSAQSVPQL